MRKATQQPFLETLVTLSLQEQVLFCVGADKPCKAAEVTLFTLVQSQIAIFFFVSVSSQKQSMRLAPSQNLNVSGRLRPV